MGGSPSMRREWIEIYIFPFDGTATGRSPSMRREWIEMGVSATATGVKAVSLHAEGVD